MIPGSSQVVTVLRFHPDKIRVIFVTTQALTEVNNLISDSGARKNLMDALAFLNRSPYRASQQPIPSFCSRLTMTKRKTYADTAGPCGKFQELLRV
jgi:hypothetical protein